MKAISITSSIILVLLFIVTMVGLDDYSRHDNWFNKISTLESDPDDDWDYVCFYPGCNHKAEVELRTDNIYSVSDGVSELVKKALTIPNTAGFQTNAGVFERAVTETKAHEGTYLVPQSDGSFKVENRTHEYEEVVGTESHDRTRFYGWYCNEHEEVAKETWKNELTETLRIKNVFYWTGKYGITAMGIVIAVSVALLVVVGWWKFRQKASEQSK